MKSTSFYLSILAIVALLVYVACHASTNVPSTNPPAKLQSVEAKKTNAPPAETEEQKKQREWNVAFQQGVIYGAAVAARNPDAMNDQSFLIRTAYSYFNRDQAAAQRK